MCEKLNQLIPLALSIGILLGFLFAIFIEYAAQALVRLIIKLESKCTNTTKK